MGRQGGLADAQARRRLVIRKGHQRERTVRSALGDSAPKKPHLHDRREGVRSTRRILPPYMRRTHALGACSETEDALTRTLFTRGTQRATAR